LLTEGVDGRAVLRADVVALTHALGGVVVLPEDAEQLFVGDALGVEDDAHDLCLAGLARAHPVVRRTEREAAGLADLGRIHAFGLPELALGPPEAAHAEDGHL